MAESLRPPSLLRGRRGTDGEEGQMLLAEGPPLRATATAWLLKYVVPLQTVQKQRKGLKLPSGVLRQGRLPGPRWRRHLD